MSVCLLQIKDRALEANTEKKLGRLHTNRGGEFNSGNFMEYCLEHGVRWQLITLNLSQQNGVVECRNTTVVGAARSKLKAKGLPN
jgi:transposase InsO family protein